MIGVNAQIETGGVGQGNVGIGFAIPVNTVKDVVASLIKNGNVEHAFLGIEGKTLTPAIARLFHVPVMTGVLVATVRPSTGAADAGVKGATNEITVEGESWPAGGDVIVKVDDQPIPTSRAPDRPDRDEAAWGQDHPRSGAGERSQDIHREARAATVNFVRPDWPRTPGGRFRRSRRPARRAEAPS